MQGFRAPAWLVLLLVAPLPAPAQDSITLDGSLGTAGPVPYDAPTGTYDVHDGLGQYSGTNLFHSFEVFGVEAGDTALFSGLDSTTNVLARVTGGVNGAAAATSVIDGTIRSTMPSANLFLMNPMGVVFGQTAVVDVPASFHVSSADALHFESGPSFITGDASPGPMLSMAAPSAFGFLVDDPADITFDRPLLSMQPGTTFSAVGGDVQIVGRGGTATTVGVPGGIVQVAAVSSAMDVPLDLQNLDARAQGPDALGDVNMTNRAILDASTQGGESVGTGRVVIRGGEVVLDDSRINVLSRNANTGEAVAIDIEASERVALESGARLQSLSFGTNAASGDIELSAPQLSISSALVGIGVQNGSAQGADLRIDVDTLHLAQGSVVLSGALGSSSGDAGAVEIEAANDVIIEGALQMVAEGTGDGGSVDITTGSLQVAGGDLSSSTSGDGHGGSISVTADAVTVEDGGQIATQTGVESPFPGGGAGNAGALTLDVVSDVNVRSGGQITTRTTGDATGLGGDLDVVSGGTVRVESAAGTTLSQISALTRSSSPDARGGDLSISAAAIELIDGGQLRTTTEGAGNAGSIRLDVDGQLLARGDAVLPPGMERNPSGAFARSSPGSTGDGGALTIVATDVVLEDGAELSTRTFGSGNSQDLTIQASGRVSLTGGASGESTISARSETGAAGNLTIEADQLTLADGGVVSTSSAGSQKAGDLTILARVVDIAGAASGLFAQSLIGATGDGGNLVVDVGERLSLSEGGRMSVESLTRGLAGDVRIQGGGDVALSSGSEVSAQVGDTDDPTASADIRIVDARSLVMSGDSVITAESLGSGAGGTVDVTANDIHISGARITTRAIDTGDAGIIVLAAANSLKLSNATLTTRAEVSGGGRIELNAGGELFVDASLIETTVLGSNAGQDAGDIDIPSPDPGLPGVPPPVPPRAVAINRSTIQANATQTNAGNITIEGSNVVVSADSIIEAESEKGIDGVIRVDTPDSQLAGQLTALPVNYVDVSRMLTTPCAARTERSGSFVVEARPARIDADLPLGIELLRVGDGTGAACADVEVVQ